MQFDPANKIVKLCADGMMLEGEAAFSLFQQAWHEAENDFEKFVAAHYMARHQKSVADKLRWDETALQLALKINDRDTEGAYPSLYLNVAKCYEDLQDVDNAKKNYELALSYTSRLPDDGYGNMIKAGIMNGIERMKKMGV